MEQLALTNQEFRHYEPQNDVLIHPQISHSQFFEEAIAAVLPSPSDESIRNKMRQLLGAAALSLTDQQIECIRAEFQFLAESWLDEFERGIFDGKTLKELLNEEG